MEDSVFKWTLWGFIGTAAAGTLLHFVWEWSGQALWLAPFVPVNESVWEHLKLLAFPAVLFTLLELIRRPSPALLWARSVGIAAGLLATVIVYYTYTGVIGRGWLWADISIFYGSALLAFGLSYALQTRFPPPTGLEVLLFAGLLALTLVCLIGWTYTPPHIQLFRDPLRGGYGLLAPRLPT